MGNSMVWEENKERTKPPCTEMRRLPTERIQEEGKSSILFGLVAFRRSRSLGLGETPERET